ncbi:hypothetical protein ACERK3_04620 [Phycisphaerales bacterium AB-hyl4]|uniref:Transposase n=1 Tax=Natronomicrosphaera hydrolytica TaxID=3242702 RepID=A0ABV4U1U7_9BACT
MMDNDKMLLTRLCKAALLMFLRSEAAGIDLGKCVEIIFLESDEHRMRKLEQRATEWGYDATADGVLAMLVEFTMIMMDQSPHCIGIDESGNAV